MAYVQRQVSSGSDWDSQLPIIDEKKLKRKQSNRESARRSRMKKQKRVEDLLNEVSQLMEEKNRYLQSISFSEQKYMELEAANEVIRAQMAELVDHHRSLTGLMQTAAEVGGFTVEIPDIAEIPDPMLRPWLVPYPMQPVMSSGYMFQ